MAKSYNTFKDNAKPTAGRVINARRLATARMMGQAKGGGRRAERGGAGGGGRNG